MSAAIDNALNIGAAQWLKVAGAAGVYTSAVAGDIDMNIAIERDIDSLDDRGLMIQRDVAFIPSGVVDVRVGDTLSVGGQNWEVMAKAADEGNLQAAHVRRLA